VTADGDQTRLALGDYRTIFDNLSEGIFLHPPDSDEILEANARRAEMLGYTREELLGLTVSDVTDDDWEPPHSPRERIEQARREGRITFEWRDERRDGATVPVEVNLACVTLGGDDHVLASVRDISERKRRERRTRAIFDQTYQFTGLMEPDGTLLEANETALAFGDLNRDDVIGKPVWECYWFQHSESVQQRVRADVQRAATGEFVRHNLEFRGIDGTDIVDFSVRPITDEHGEVTLLIPEGRVITELLEHQRRVDVYNRVMRHNLRNKLTIIDGLTSEIRRLATDDRIEEFADGVLVASERIDDIVERIREFDHLREQDRTETVAVAELLERIAREVAEADDTPEVRTALAPVSVDTNRALLRLVIEQLVENALEHGASPVCLTATETADGGVDIAVHDAGPGIPRDEFEPMIEGTATQLEHTTGIGLLIAKWGVDELGGEIAFESDDEGTTVTVRIPVGL
jgi:PAS domain S-box-containing protein